MEESQTIKLAEDAIFLSIQGEGKLCGIPSLFLRVAGCNLFCEWRDDDSNPSECDTTYASYRVTKSLKMEVGEIYNEIKRMARESIGHIVITGGEPLLQAAPLTTLSRMLKGEGFHITLETNGTIYDDKLSQEISLFSISPKLSSSTPQSGEWAKIHEERRLNIEVLSNYIEVARRIGADIQLKFVVSREGDFEEIDSLLKSLPPLPKSSILLMPAGASIEAIDKKAPLLCSYAIENGWRYCDRLQIRVTEIK